MSTLKRSQRVLSGINLIGNFVERPLRVGDIVLNDDGQHIIWGNITDLFPEFTLDGKLITANKSDLEYTTESGVEVNLGGSAGSSVASGEVQLKFNAKNSAFVSLKEYERTSIKLALVDALLKNYWKEKNFDSLLNRHKYHFISEVITARSGTVIFSEDKNNEVVLKARNAVPLTSMSVLGSGEVDYVRHSKSTLHIISANPIQPLYSAVRYKANGNFEVVG